MSGAEAPTELLRRLLVRRLGPQWVDHVSFDHMSDLLIELGVGAIVLKVEAHESNDHGNRRQAGTQAGTSAVAAKALETRTPCHRGPGAKAATSPAATSTEAR